MLVLMNRTMRFTVLAMVLQLAGCSCRPISQYCEGKPCPTAPQLEESLLQNAEYRWTQGSCTGIESGSCSGGGSWALESDFCHTRSFFDKSGALVFVEAGCEGDNQSYGSRPRCDAIARRDLCAEARKRLKFRHLAMTFDAPLALRVRVDDVRVARNGTTLAPGIHVLSFDEHRLEIDVVEEPVTLAARLRLNTWSPALRLSDEAGRAGPLRSRDCVAQGCAYQIEVPGHDSRVGLVFKATFGLPDGGPRPRAFGDGSAY